MRAADEKISTTTWDPSFTSVGPHVRRGADVSRVRMSGLHGIGRSTINSQINIYLAKWQRLIFNQPTPSVLRRYYALHVHSIQRHSQEGGVFNLVSSSFQLVNIPINPDQTCPSGVQPRARQAKL